MYEETEGGLQHVNDVAEIVVRHETVVCSSASDEETDELVLHSVSQMQVRGSLDHMIAHL